MCCPDKERYSTGENCHMVQTGDTLYSISKIYNVSLEDLLEFNPGIDPDHLAPGLKIIIPLTAPPASCSSGSNAYIVQEGDTFYQIAGRHKIRPTSLLKANPGLNPDALLIGQCICIPIISGTYTSDNYRVRFVYPYRWSRFDESRCEGIDGFFQLSLVSSDSEPEEVCRSEAYHRLRPYGARPVIDSISICGHKACRITPSPDQPMEMRNQAALVIQYFCPVIVEAASYQYLLLRTDANHLKDIAESLEFICE